LRRKGIFGYFQSVFGNLNRGPTNNDH